MSAVHFKPHTQSVRLYLLWWSIAYRPLMVIRLQNLSAATLFTLADKSALTVAAFSISLFMYIGRLSAEYRTVHPREQQVLIPCRPSSFLSAESRRKFFMCQPTQIKTPVGENKLQQLTLICRPDMSADKILPC